MQPEAARRVPPPPLLFAAIFLLGYFVQRGLWGGWMLPAPARLLGMALLAIGLALALSAFGLFVRNRTTLVPHGSASRLVVRGPYRLTRNPMYVSLVLAYLGLSLWLHSWLALLLLPLPVAIVARLVIPFEEARLEQIFGSDYAAYRARVRRWL